MNSLTLLPKKLKVLFAILVVVAVGGLISTYTFWSKVQSLENPNLATANEIKQLVSDVGKFLVLPTNETPTLATVSDPSKLKDQPFFANAQVGDKVLVYTGARKAILWRPSIQKVIEVAPLSFVTAPAPTTPTTPAVKTK